MRLVYSSYLINLPVNDLVNDPISSCWPIYKCNRVRKSYIIGIKFSERSCIEFLERPYFEFLKICF